MLELKCIFVIVKKATLIAFTGFYLALSLGFSLNLHYCGGKLANLRIVVAAPNCCCDAGGDKNCCSDASISLQMDLDQQVTYPPSWEINLPIVSVSTILFQEDGINFIPERITPHYPNPPPIRSQETRIKMGSLTFYG